MKVSLPGRSSPHTTVSASQILLQKMVSHPPNGEIAFAIVLPPTASNATSSTTPAATTTDRGEFIGYAGIWNVPLSELVFMIGQSYWRQGYMTEVLAALMPMFWQNGFKRVWANVDSENVASIKLLRRSGFIQCGTSVIELTEGKGENIQMEIANPDSGEEESKEEDGGKDDSEGGSDEDA